jgi:hypothetical protein
MRREARYGSYYRLTTTYKGCAGYLWCVAVNIFYFLVVAAVLLMSINNAMEYRATVTDLNRTTSIGAPPICPASQGFATKPFCHLLLPTKQSTLPIHYRLFSHLPERAALTSL